MFLSSIASAVPPLAYSQQDCWQSFLRSPYAPGLPDTAHSLVEKVLTGGSSGIDKRHFALGEQQLFGMDAQSLNLAFEREAPVLAAEALRPALDRAGVKPEDLDAVFVCTCTGYLCPGISSHLAEAMGIRQDAVLHDVVVLGCGAAIPTLRAASHFLAAEPDAVAAVVAVELCSAAFYLDADPGVLVSACIFGDGASASIWTGDQPKDGPTWRMHDFRSLHLPERRELLRFENRGGKLRNRLHRSVPQVAADAVGQLYDQAVNGQPLKVISHTGGRDVLAAIAKRLPGQSLEESLSVLRDYGNMSSPSVMFALERYLDELDEGSPDELWLTAFGAGFSAHACRLSPVE